MRSLTGCFLLLFCSRSLLAAEKLTSDDYRLARRYGISASEMNKAHDDVASKINSNEFQKSIINAFENDPVKSALIVDQAIANVINLSEIILKAEGHAALADEIKSTYLRDHRHLAMQSLLRAQEMGDHEPLSPWLDEIHDKIHEAIGSLLCKWTHIHDIEILNHGVPVVFSPKKYDLHEYLDHFSGHLIWGWYWEHHGVAGVVTYWSIDGVCIAATYGMGAVAFVCGPVAGAAENLMDKRLAPPIGGRIWKRANED